MGTLLWYGLGGFGILLALFFTFFFLARPLIQTYLFKNQGWFIIGFITAIFVGWYFGDFFSLGVCFGVHPFWLCDYTLRFIIIITCCIVFWVITTNKKREN